jgi:hypothetical protein
LNQTRGESRKHLVISEMLIPQPVTFLNLIPSSKFRSLTSLRRQGAQIFLPGS